MKLLLLDLDDTLLQDLPVSRAVLEDLGRKAGVEGFFARVKARAEALFREAPFYPWAEAIGHSALEALWARYSTPGLEALAAWAGPFRERVFREALEEAGGGPRTGAGARRGLLPGEAPLPPVPGGGGLPGGGPAPRARPRPPHQRGARPPAGKARRGGACPPLLPGPHLRGGGDRQARPQALPHGPLRLWGGPGGGGHGGGQPPEGRPGGPPGGGAIGSSPTTYLMLPSSPLKLHPPRASSPPHPSQ